jgi:CHAD domain-containing protein
MVADNHVEDAVEETGVEAFLRVRGWGRISYLPEPEKLQDQVGEIIGQALTEFWLKHCGKESLRAIPYPDRYGINKRGEVTEDKSGKYVLRRDYDVANTTLNAALSHMSDQEETIRQLRAELASAKETLALVPFKF